jgi:hypothetical protein
LELLARQGFISCERRRGKPPFYKLRFRRRGEQVVRYVGCDARQAELLRNELTELQRARQAKRQLSALTRQARRMLRQAKRQIEPTLNEHGLAFHGLAVRRSRRLIDIGNVPKAMIS